MKKELEVSLAKELCIICTKELDGPIIMNTVLTEKEAEKVKKLHNKVIGFAEEPCEDCKNLIKRAFVFVGFDEEKSDMDNLPEGFYRTGHIVGVKKEIPLVQEFIKERFPIAFEKGFCIMPYQSMKDFGLIR